MIQLFSANIDHNQSTPLYVQLYRFIKGEISGGRLPAGERLPSLREAARQTGLSITTCSLAYGQLETEGYIFSKPQSGFYVADLPAMDKTVGTVPGVLSQKAAKSGPSGNKTAGTVPTVLWHDPEAFDFRSWRKCVTRVYNDCEEQLFTRGDVQGELALRREIARYVYEARGVYASEEQIVVGAGTQQLTAHLGRILKKLGIAYVSVEEPGYLPVRRMFLDAGFSLREVPVGPEGLRIDRLPVNIPSAVYVSPANQFPTGAVMPVAKRYELLEWAKENDSVIIEDDYDSELRYFGQPIPALQGLDKDGRVVYISSFSSTLFPAVRISYMVLPAKLTELFASIREEYSQTCSKTEQLALAYFMADGTYESNIRKKRALYARKLTKAVRAFGKYGGDRIRPLDTRSGISLLLLPGDGLDVEAFCRRGAELGLRILPPENGAFSSGPEKRMVFYYNQVPLGELDELIRRLCAE